MGNFLTVPVGLLLHPRAYGIVVGTAGTISHRDTLKRVRYLVEDAIVAHHDGQPLAYTDIVREEIDRALEQIGRRKMPYTQDSIQYLGWNPPKAANPGVYWNYVYADIKSAYFNIYRRSGLDTQLKLGKYLSQGAIMPGDWPILQEKRARVALYGMTRSQLLHRIADGRVYSVQSRSKFFNPSVHGLIMLVLHDLAAFAISECQAEYVNTDGYILPAARMPLLADYALNTWGLEITARSEVGEAHIRGLARYRVADLESIPYNRSKEEEPFEYIAILPPELTWLKRRWQQFL